MRSRYTAYALQNETYLLASWHRSTCPASLDLVSDVTEWIKLTMLAAKAGKQRDSSGTVEFIAEFKFQDQRQQVHEVSRFLKEDNRWYYLDGEISDKCKTV